jgi:hypothetical protein
MVIRAFGHNHDRIGETLKSFIAGIKTRIEIERQQAQARMRYRATLPIRVVEAVLMAMLAGVLFALVAEPLGFAALTVGLAAFLALMLRSDAGKVHFRFGLVFGIEWFLLPVVVSISTHNTDASLWGMDTGLWLALSIPLGVIMGFFFLFVALYFFRC